MKIQMELLSDTVFGNGVSVPGAENISVQCDAQGFPYYKGSTFKGVFREEMERYLLWSGVNSAQVQEKLRRMLGKSGADTYKNSMVFTDLRISEQVKKKVLSEIEKRYGSDGKQNTADIVLSLFSHIRTFTQIEESGSVKRGSLRMARCIDQGNWFYGEIFCEPEDEELVIQTLKMVQWIGTMRNRGFGNVRITKMEVDKK